MGVCRESFTSRLIEAIKTFGWKDFTVVQLYERLIQDGKNLTMPEYHLLGTKRPSGGGPSGGGPSIVLERLQLASRKDTLEQPTNMCVASVTNRPPQDSQEPSVPSSTELSSSSGEIRLQLTLSLPFDAAIPDRQRWNEWVSEVPCDVRKDEISIQADMFVASVTNRPPQDSVEMWSSQPCSEFPAMFPAMFPATLRYDLCACRLYHSISMGSKTSPRRFQR